MFVPYLLTFPPPVSRKVTETNIPKMFNISGIGNDPILCVLVPLSPCVYTENIHIPGAFSGNLFQDKRLLK